MEKIFNIYCDESRHTSDPGDRYAIIGAIRCPRERKRDLVHRFHLLQAKYQTQGEIGWSKVSPNKMDFYVALIQWFLEDPDFEFRCLVVDREALDHERYNAGDAELGFYKLYYQMLVHWLKPGSAYYIYLDWQQNSAPGRFSRLRDILQHRLAGRARLECLEPVNSDNQPLIQLTDVLIGAVGYAWNQCDSSQAKVSLCNRLAVGLGKASLCFSTAASEQKFNVFQFSGRR